MIKKQPLLPPDPGWREMVAAGSLRGRPVVVLGETSSTNDVALEMAREGAVSGSLVVAESQSDGRGRLGRKWFSQPGTGLYFSMILRPEIPLDQLPVVTLAAGVACCHAVRRVTGLKVLIKWPNDLMAGGRKFGGILAETTALDDPVGPVVVLGVGINISTPRESFPAELRKKVVALGSLAPQSFLRSDLLAALVEGICQVVGELETVGREKILARWQQLDLTLGREMNWLNTARQVVRGVSLGIDESGRLLIRDHGGKIHQVLSGDISLAGNIREGDYAPDHP